ncbi:MAG: ATP-binding protein [Elusimicrobia bacterium]|nr:ATP-binding protein [Elusimicrobiota bacterium]
MRCLSPEILRFLAEEKKMAFIAGPRQAGKTTLAKHLLSVARSPGGYFNWDIESHRKAILKNPEGFWIERGGPRIVLDEIHKYPRWKRFLKGLYDAAGRDVEILVTGSGRLDVYQRGGDSLFGRYGLYRLHPFTLGELLAPDRGCVRPPEDFWKEALAADAPSGAEEALTAIERLTGFPEPLFSGSEGRLRRWRRSRNHLVLREDLRDLTRIRDIGLLESLVSLLPERIGAPLSLNALSEDLGVAFGTMRGWIQSLARLYYLFEIRPFAGRLARTLRREAKVYLFDYSAIEDPGARFENLLALHLLKLCDAWNDWGFGDFRLHYARDKEKREVDFLISEAEKPYALIEAKLSETDIAAPLRYFHERLRPAFSVQVVRRLPAQTCVKKPDGAIPVPACRFLSRI